METYYAALVALAIISISNDNIVHTKVNQEIWKHCHIVTTQFEGTQEGNTSGQVIRQVVNKPIF